MKIRVEHADGKAEVMSLIEPVLLVEGKYMNRLTDGSGVDYFFLHDGTYDGWGSGTCGLTSTDGGHQRHPQTASSDE